MKKGCWMVVLMIVALVSGCGGSDEPIDERKTIDPVDCSAPGRCK